MIYRVYALFTATKYVGDVEAGSKQEAEEKAYEQLGDEMYASLCHQCSNELDLNDMESLTVEEME